MPIYTLCSVTVPRARPSWPVSVKAALEECDPLATDIPGWGLHLLERVRLCSRGGWLGWSATFPPGVWSAHLSRPYIGRRWR